MDLIGWSIRQLLPTEQQPFPASSFRSFKEFVPYTSRHNQNVQTPLFKKLLSYNFFLRKASSLWNPLRDERTVKFFSPSPVLIRWNWIRSSLICKIFENHQSNPVLIRQCKIMYFYFASWSKIVTAFCHFQNLTRKCLLGIRGKSTAGVIWPLGDTDCFDWSSDKDNIYGLA